MKKNKLPIVYSDDYNIRFFGFQKLHPFDTEKYQKIVSHLKKTLAITDNQLYEPSKEISNKELLKVHSKAYLESLENKQNIAQVAEMGLLAKLPLFLLKNKLLKPIKKAVAGTLLAGELALKHNWAINLSGGYHHAKRENGEGFCFFADINLLIEHLRQKQLIQSAMIVDLDAHHVPLVIEEIYNLNCNITELEEFLLGVEGNYNGLMGHYFGTPIEELYENNLIHAIQKNFLQFFKDNNPN